MKGYIEERAVKTAEYIIETKATVGQTARKFGVSKSTVHKDVTARLTRINPALAMKRARCLMSTNKSAISAADWQRAKNTCTNSNSI